MNLNQNQKLILQILNRIKAETTLKGLSAIELSHEVGITKENINQNLRKLREGGYPVKIVKWEMTQGRGRPVYGIGRTDVKEPASKDATFYTKRVYQKHKGKILAKLQAKNGKPASPWQWLLNNAR